MSEKKPKRSVSTDSDKKSKKADKVVKKPKKSIASNVSQSVINEQKSEMEDIDQMSLTTNRNEAPSNIGFRQVKEFDDNLTQFFNDTLEELTAEPLSSPLYRIVSVDEAFRTRSAWCSHVLSTALTEKRKQLLTQMQSVDFRMEEIKRVRGIIERDIRAEFGSIAERLRASEGAKIAVLMHDMAEIQKDVDRIDHVAGVSKDLLSGESPDIKGFLSRWKSIQQNIEQAFTKPFKTSVDVYPHDLPRELAEKRQMIEKTEALEELLKERNTTIYNLTHEIDERVKIEVDKIIKETKNEFHEYQKLIDERTQYVEGYMHITTNIGLQVQELETKTEEKSMKIVDIIQTLKDLLKKSSISKKIVGNNIINKIANNLFNTRRGLQSTFKLQDKNNDGHISIANFKNHVKHACKDISDEDLESLSSNQLNRNNNRVFYADFLEVIDKRIKELENGNPPNEQNDIE